MHALPYQSQREGSLRLLSRLWNCRVPRAVLTLERIQYPLA